MRVLPFSASRGAFREASVYRALLGDEDETDLSPEEEAPESPEENTRRGCVGGCQAPVPMVSVARAPSPETCCSFSQVTDFLELWNLSMTREAG